MSVLGTDLRDRRQREAFLPRIAICRRARAQSLPDAVGLGEHRLFRPLFGMESQARDTRIQRLLIATGLAPFSDRPAGKLSGGMKQKLGLCCALVHDPDLLILDEPTTGVDPLSRRQFWALVDDLRAESGHMTVIVATAYMEEAERFEYLVAMDGGRVLISDSTRNVMTRTGAATLEKAYISLLPKEQRAQASGLYHPSLPGSRWGSGHRGGGADTALWRLRRRRRCQFPDRPWRDLWFPRLQRLR